MTDAGDVPDSCTYTPSITKKNTFENLGLSDSKSVYCIIFI